MEGKAAVTDWSELIRAVAELVKALQWPMVALMVTVFFKDEVRKLIHRLKKGKLLGAEADFEAAVDALVEGIKQDVTTGDSFDPPQKGMLRLKQAVSDSIERTVVIIASHSPRAALMLLATEIHAVAREKAMAWLARKMPAGSQRL